MRDEILNNTKKEVVEFHVIADGVAGAFRFWRKT